MDQETVDRILAYEKANSRPLFMYAASGLAALSIVLGLVAFVAANWDGLPDSVKLGGDLLVGVALVVAIFRIGPEDSGWGREVLLTVLGGWTLASIALIGQVYQLGGEARDALALWCLLTLPVFIQGRSRLVASVWFAGYLWTFMEWTDELLGFLQLEDETALALIPALSWFVITAFYQTRLGEKRPHLASVFGGAAQCLLVIMASYMVAIGLVGAEEMEGSVWVAMGLTLPILALLWRRLPAQKGGWREVMVMTQGLLFLPLLIGALAGSGPLGGELVSSLGGLLLFVGYWILIARAALLNGQTGVFRFATFVVAVRLIVVYFELFESLLNTGLVFLSGGVLALVVIRTWHKKNQELLARELGEGGS